MKRILILGGTIFLGRHLTDQALARGHAVTLFTRGRHGADLFPDAEHLHGDRDGDLQALEGRTWDVAIDTCGYVPRIVRASAHMLRDAVERYVFVSTLSVYADFSAPGMTEAAPLATLEDSSTEVIDGETYGGLKALAEQAAQEAMPGRVLVIRPGLIVGPHDPSDRFTYWPVRIARGGQVLAPERPGLPVQFIDVRDLATWMLDTVERRAVGIYNATGLGRTVSLGEVLDACNRASQADATCVWVPPGFLAEHAVQPYVDLPLWLPDEPENAGASSVDCSRAIHEDLRFRPLDETVRDTLAWAGTRPADHVWRAGLEGDREQDLLRLYALTTARARSEERPR